MTDDAAAEVPTPSGPPAAAAPLVHPYLHVIAVAFIGAVSVLAWLYIFELGNRLLWENDVITANPWLFPAICIPFSLLVGYLVKRHRAPTNLDESLLESLSGDVTRIDWRALPVNIVMAWASLFSGAVLGPEGGIGGIGSKIAILYAERVGIPVQERSRLVFSTLASSYNGLIANPLFTGVLGTELVSDPQARKQNLPANLIGGTIGFLVFYAVGNTGLIDYLDLPTTETIGPAELLMSVPLALIGFALAIVAGAFMQASARFFGRFTGREIERALIAGVVFSVVGMVAPIVLFSGESQIKTVSADPAAYGVVALLAMAIVKLALLAVAFKSGFLGGPTFPAIFASTCVALAIGLIFPGLRGDVLIGSVMAGFLIVLFKAPLMVILLTSVMLQAGPELMALIVLAVSTVMVVQPIVMAGIARRRAARAGAG